MRIWIAGGGTGGHVYPGLAVLRALEALGPVEPVYVGGTGNVEERLAGRAGLRFVGVPTGGLHGMGPSQAARNLLRLTRGVLAALRLGRRERPQALFATGGYASVPFALAAWALRVPILLYLPDIEPGRAVRFLAPLATRVAVTTEDSCAYFPARKTVVTGYPVRAEFAALDRQAARSALGLADYGPVALALGGSLGARSVNRAVLENLEEWLRLAQLVHVSGELDWPEVIERAEGLPPGLRPRYHPHPYLHEIGPALATADLAVCRAGASVLGELPYFGLPAILVPYPYAWRYQRVNAEWLARRGAALVLADERLGQDLLPMAQQLLADRAELARMRERSHGLARPDAAARLAEILAHWQEET